MRKLLAVILSAVMCMTIAVSASAGEGPDISLGSWSVNHDIKENPLSESAAELFAKATEGLLGVKYTPIAVLGEQVVAGVNVAYLCEAETVTEEPEVYLAVVVVYEDVSGSASVSSITRIEITDDAEETTENLLGGYTINSNVEANPLPDDTAEVFAKAAEQLLGVNYTPIAVLGEQVVSGKNIAYLCAAETVTEIPEVYYALVIVYQDLEGNVSVNSAAEIKIDDLISEEITFTLIISNTVNGDCETNEVTTEVSTLGDYMRSMENCEWQDSEYGIYVTSINGVSNDDEAATYWSYYVNGEYAMVGADECALENGMEIMWAYEGFSWEE